MNTIRERMLMYTEYKGMSARSFEISCGLSNGYVTNIKSVGSDKLTKIHVKYPELSMYWLLFGEGEMLLQEDDDPATVQDRNNSGEIDALRETIATQRITIQSLLDQIDLLKKGDSSAQQRSVQPA